MCEQNSVSYNEGDVVWVKLGPCWWPGEVVSLDKLPSDISGSFKKSPLAVVKFFDEEKYEFVRQVTHISLYNSSKKYDYIKKGMDLYRAKHGFMDKFQEDVLAAEKKTDGDPNILNDPRLEPEKKPDYASIFGSPKFKKKDSPARSRGKGGSRKSHSLSGTAKKMATVITHPRFLGQDDSEIRILVQTPPQTKLPDQEYKCYVCNFKTNRIDVIVFHNKSHMYGGSNLGSSPKKTKKTSPKNVKRMRFPVSKTTTIEEDLELLRQGVSICSNDEDSSISGMSSKEDSMSISSSDEEPPVVVKRKSKSASPVKPKKAKPTPPPREVEKQTDIRTDLLAEWDDDEDEEEIPPPSTRLSPKPEENVKDTENDVKSDEKGKSCFDFVEDEEDLVTTVEGRKIPRVIPPASERRKSIQESKEKSGSSTPKNIEDNVIESETDKAKKGLEIDDKIDPDAVDKKKDSQFQKEFEAFNNALQEITVPEILDVPSLNKYEQNFHSAKTIKFPDKKRARKSTPPPKEASTSSKTSNVTTKIDKCKPAESAEANKTETPPAVETTPSSNKTETPPAVETTPSSNKTETPPAVETTPSSEPTKEPVIKNTEVATKLTNPKKRFVKTFEDETKNSSKEELKEEIKQDSKDEPSPKTVKKEIKLLQVAKLKTQLMKKLDASTKKENLKRSDTSSRKENATSKVESTTSRRLRRSKIFAEIRKVESATSRVFLTKRPISESASSSDNETKTNAKKKKYTPEKDVDSHKNKDTKSEVVERISAPEQSMEVIDTSKKESVEDNNKNEQSKSSDHLEYLTTSPSKLFSDLKVDKDNNKGTTILSESQSLTIQSIIGVTSPILPAPAPLNYEIEKNQNEGEITPTEEIAKEQRDIDDKEKSNEEIDRIAVDHDERARDEIKTISETTEEFMKDATEEKIKDINNQIFNISKKLDEAIPEKLPDEIIETPEDESKQNSDESNDREPEDKVTVEQVEKPMETMLSEQKFDEAIKEILKQTEKEKKVIVEEINQEVADEKEYQSLKEEMLALKDTKEDKFEFKISEEIDNKVQKPDKTHELVEKTEIPNEEHLDIETIETKEVAKTEIPNKEHLHIMTIKTKEGTKTETPNKEHHIETIETREDTKTIAENVTMEKLKDCASEVDVRTDLPIESPHKSTNDLVKSLFEEGEMVNIEGNLTVVTESDLADKQVEIITSPEVTKPITLASFSMDFCEDETYVKADTIIPDLTRSKSPLPSNSEDKTSSKVVPIKIMDAPNKFPEENLKETSVTESTENKKSDGNNEKLFDIQDIESTKFIEGSKMKKYENITPAKEVPPSVIMEGFEENREDVSEDRLTIDESTAKPLAILEETAIAKSDVKASTVGNSTIEEKQLYKEVVPHEKEEIIIPPIDISVESEVAKITDSIAEHEVVVPDKQHSTTSTKLLEILTDKPKPSTTKATVLPAILQTEGRTVTPKTIYSKPTVAKQLPPGLSRTPKATILSDKLIKPLDESKTVSVKKVTSKRSYQDVEDIDTYIIQKPLKKVNVTTESDAPGTPKVIKKTPVTSKGKARILQQTIITPTGDILQPPVGHNQSDDNMFDINSMPIVLSDELLTAEGIENMQIVLQENTPTTTPKTQINPIKRTQVTTVTQQQPVKLLNKTQSPQVGVGLKAAHVSQKLGTTSSPAGILNKHKLQKFYPTATTTTKISKHSPSVITQPGKQGKFIIVPATTTATGTKYTVGKRPAIVKKPPQKILTPVSKIPDATTPMTAAGNKIMILKSQGQQQKILLTTPQKQLTPSKLKGRAIGQKQIITKELHQQKGANIISQTIVNSKGQVTTVANQSSLGINRGQQIIATSVAQQNRNVKIDPTKMRKVQQPQQRLSLSSELTKPGTSGQQRTIIIKNPQGQTVKKIHGTDDALLERQVAEQLQAISRASASQHLKELSPKTPAKLQPKKPFVKKQEPIRQTVTKTTLQSTHQKDVAVPPLAPISPTKKVTDTRHIETNELSTTEDKPEEPKRPPHQLVIQDAQGNQTTITEGQILALPSEAIDGQPHSYVLVTLDETGNLTPLNSEALMSLDPNLNLTSDLGNMVLQIDQGSAPETEAQVAETQQQSRPTIPKPVEAARTNSENLLLKESTDKPSVDKVLLTETPTVTETAEQNVQAVINSGEMGQLIITGDAATAQKFLESLAEGNADLANLLANAEGNVLIQADGQQILINTDSENPMLVMNPEGIAAENSEGSGNPIFASQPVKNQDILAAALADTDVFQQDQSISHSPSKVAQSQLSPNSALYPMGVTNVLETNSMSSPIMTPLEVPSINSKKIDDENEILKQVPKNVDLPITITDPNIVQTVAHQHVASLMASELQSNLDLPLTIQDPGLSVTSAEMSSPSFVYSLPTLDDTVDISQKAFSGSISMPLLTEEPEESINESSSNSTGAITNKVDCKKLDEDEKGAEKEPKISQIDEKKSEDDDKDDSDDKKTDFLDSEGLCAIRGGICNSLSEPPPDMFDFAVENQSYDPSNLSQTADMDIAIDSTPSSDSNVLNDRESSISSMDDRKNEDSTLYGVNTTSPSTNTDDSCEIPVQPPIIAKLYPEENGTSDSRIDNDKVTTDRDVV